MVTLEHSTVSKTIRRKDHLRTLADDIAETPLAVRRGKGARASMAHRNAKVFNRKSKAQQWRREI